MSARAAKAIRICRELATFTEEPGRTTRTFLSEPMRDVHRVLGDWMRQLGVNPWVDGAGNLRGVRNEHRTPRLVIASHLDTVPGAGAFDGIVGVVLGLILLEETRANDQPFAIEVIGFSEEEGVRYKTPFLGSRAVVGTLDPATIEKMTPALRHYGLDPASLPQARLHPLSVAYLEFHIEQGPVLENLNIPLGVVDAIAGQSRFTVQFTGSANHAGTTPMALRKDALAAAAEWILQVEAQALATPGLVATVGRMDVTPNASNVIPGDVAATLDVRHIHDQKRSAAAAAMLDAARSVGQRRGIQVRVTTQLEQAAVLMSADLTGRLANAVSAAGHNVHHLPSGAGHDAMIVAPFVPSTMLFMRSPGGVSHHPDETVLTDDVEAAIGTGLHFLNEVFRV